MRYDDSSVFWDKPGFFYDMSEGAGLSNPNRMSKPKLDLKSKTPLQKVQKAEDLVTATTGNANFPTPTPPLATLTAKADAVSAAFSEREAAKNTLDQKQTALETAEAELDAALVSFSAYVESASGGDAAKILSSGLAVKGQASPIGPMPQVDGLDSTIGDAEGRVNLRWSPVKGAKTYEVQTCPDPITAGGWKAAGLPTKASLILNGLPSGGRCWFRVRAIGSAGPGPWSDPAVKTVP
jgi:hypothetical protein